MKQRLTFELQFIPDGATTIVKGVVHPSGQEFEFWVKTASEEDMSREAQEIIAGSLRKSGLAVTHVSDVTPIDEAAL